MKKFIRLIICTPDKEIARKKIKAWYGDKKDFTIISVTHTPPHGCSVYFVYEGA